jgi:protein-S-isoprenylcysteine O-methyltransferase Ste14
MVSLVFRNLFFTILHPGLVAGLIPFWILGRKAGNLVTRPWRFYQYPGAIVFAIGLIIMSLCIINFARKGKGTLSPADPTKRLVIAGAYRFSRNPMYIGVMIILIGEAIFFQSVNLWIYLPGIFLCFNLFILLFEEPRLRRDFGDAYRRYCREVRRWI